ncbi:hypothetical protein [Klebsiella pneumoniae]|uniref:hypothetical protein n=1 Tax=Klebsiella pneumoniae TaxID=573 RepID=UPI00124B00D4|nr:hypothetical protein [Klebsiella pneumoniae]KAB1755505.1 hypothetical protein FXO05_21830 [Klebsiella pneumoniae]MBV7375665.1 hypothetical protein [Klebsiella pneumoniae]HCJ2415481.1 hypothetical protein [Klebsiella pneumoniae]HCJ2745234.1 hypothetical protein [Klebsiella pneumoniae]
MALSNIELLTIFNKAITHPNKLLVDNSIRIQRAKETIKKEHARGFYFGDKQVNTLIANNIDPYHIYVISPENKSRQDECSLVIFPFDISKLLPIIGKLEGIDLGHIQLSSNFNMFKIHNKLKSDEYCGVGYSLKIDKEENLWRLIVELKKHLLLPPGAPEKLSSIYYQSGLPRSKIENNTKQNLLEYFSLI